MNTHARRFLLGCVTAALWFFNEPQSRAGTNSLGMEMISIPATTFLMGEDHGGDWDERPAHNVVLSRPFRISAAEVSLDQYREFRPSHNCSSEGKATGTSWHDAEAFCAWLSQREGKTYRLPTEAEWECACRAGTRTPFWSGTNPPANPEAANPWGLKGTHDAVMEWCYDWYGPYPLTEQRDPVGVVTGMVKVVRGDKPDTDERLKDEKGRVAQDYHRSANRAGLPPAFGIRGGSASATGGEGEPGCHMVGFRVVQAELPKTAPAPAPAPFVRQCVQPPTEAVAWGPATNRPYFRKRFLLPIPPDNSPDQAIAAAGLPPSFRKHNHSPAFEVCPNGDLLLVIYTSYFEYEPGVSLMAARLRFGADQWDMPEPMFDLPDVNDHAPLLWTDWAKTGQIFFAWGNPKMARGAYPFNWMTSGNSGAGWSPVHFPLFNGPIGPHSRQPINTAFRDAAGTIYFPSDAEKDTSVLWGTRDEGETWFDTGGRSAGRHTTYCLLKDGAILGMGGKNTAIDGYMPKAVSRDGGKTWAVTKTPFPALRVNQRPSLLRLRSGRLFFAGDFQQRGNIAPEGVTQRGSYVALSDDDGETWRIKPLPGAQRHERPDLQAEPPTLGYSVARQAPNGMIHLVTTMNTPCLHFELNEAWILDEGTNAPPESELMRSHAARVAQARSFTDTFVDGHVRARWSGGVADDGRFLLNGPVKWYFPNGRKHYEATYRLGRRTGSETLWRADGTVAWRWDYRKDGGSLWTQYWENGRKKAESAWRGFRADGRARTWSAEGRLLSEVRFQDGSLQPSP